MRPRAAPSTSRTMARHWGARSRSTDAPARRDDASTGAFRARAFRENARARRGRSEARSLVQTSAETRGPCPRSAPATATASRSRPAPGRAAPRREVRVEVLEPDLVRRRLVGAVGRAPLLDAVVAEVDEGVAERRAVVREGHGARPQHAPPPDVDAEVRVDEHPDADVELAPARLEEQRVAEVRGRDPRDGACVGATLRTSLARAASASMRPPGGRVARARRALDGPASRPSRARRVDVEVEVRARASRAGSRPARGPRRARRWRRGRRRWRCARPCPRPRA